MQYNISKELFETIMNEKIIEYRGVFGPYISGTYNNYVNLGCGIAVVSTDGGIVSCSVNDFFFKCKKYALKQNISMYSYIHELNGGVEIVPKKKCNWLDNKKFKAESEQQAVFDACQWILENKGTK